MTELVEWPPKLGDLWRDREGGLWAWRRYTLDILENLA